MKRIRLERIVVQLQVGRKQRRNRHLPHRRDVSTGLQQIVSLQPDALGIREVCGMENRIPACRFP